MLQLRPTFSESWYRVAGLKPKLRAVAQISRQFFRGERWYVVRDPAGNQFHRLSDPAYRFVGLLDGRRSVSEAWDLVGGHLADDAPTQPEVIQILSQLYSANLLETDITPDATVLLRRHKQLSKRKMQNRLMNILFPRMPIWDPDRFILRWMPVAKFCFSKFGACVWLVVLISALVTLAPQWSALGSAAGHALDMKNNWENIFYLYACFVLIKFIHECGHAFSCRRFGGECHEMGIMLLVLVPTPYVDASTAWAFPNKWHRIFVGAGGMIVELFFAAICAFIWRYTNPVTYPLINQLAYNTMFIASISTLVFNANPLLRYDGYYILSDFLEIPNLRQKSTEYAMGIIKRYVFDLKLPHSLPPLGQCAWLLFYAIASSIYRVFVGIVIMVVVLYKVPILGILMAVGGLVTWLVVPVVKLVRYLALDPELERCRRRAIAFSAGVAAVVIVFVGLVPYPMHIDFNGIVQPDDPPGDNGMSRSGLLKSGVEGRVVAVNAHDGDMVKAGDVILEMANPDIKHDLDVAHARLAEIDAKIRKARVLDLNELIQAKAEKLAWQDKLDDTVQRQERLQVKAPFDGQLIAPNLRELPDTFLVRGQEIGRVEVIKSLLVKGDIDQKDFQLVDADAKPTVEIRLSGLLSGTLAGVGNELQLLPAAVNDLADPAIGQLGGGDMQVDPRDPKGTRTQIPTFEARVKIDNSKQQYFPGQRAYVRLTLKSRPLIWQWTVRFLQLIRTRDNGQWM